MDAARIKKMMKNSHTMKNGYMLHSICARNSKSILHIQGVIQVVQKPNHRKYYTFVELCIFHSILDKDSALKG